MKKVGIITFHGAKNYGAVLQAYALQKSVGELGNECEIVDYVCESIKKGYKPFQFRKNDPVMSVLKSLLMFRKRRLRIKRFSSFYNGLLRLSKKTYTSSDISESKNNYDIFITGSDQVWGPGAVSINPDPVYFLRFADNKQKYSYAASFGVEKLSDEKVPVIKNLLDGFQSFSVREDSAVDIVKNIIGKKAQVNIDPTFLRSASEWKKIAVTKLNTPYILVFNVKPVKSLITFAEKLSEKKNIPVIYITDNPQKKRKNFTYVVAPSVEEFLGYFLNATYVVTNSFHGTAFSVIFHKNMFVEFDTAKSRNNRAENLLNKLGIDREIKNSNATETKINWDYVDKIVAQEKNKSMDYLRAITQ